MNLKSRAFFNKFCGGTIAVAGVFTSRHVMGAQSVLMAPPPVPLQPLAAQEESTNNEMSVFLPSYDNKDNSLPQPFKFGGIVFRPHPLYRFTYATGIQSGTNNSERSIIQEFSPGIAVDLGRHWMVDYTPTIRFYSNRAFRNTIDHSATLTGGTSYEDWSFNLSQSYVKSDSTLVDTAGQTRTQAYDTELGAAYQINDKMYAQFGVSQQFNLVDGFQDSKTWSSSDWLNYVYTKRLDFGLGIGGGYTLISADQSGSTNPDQSFENAKARVRWRALDKLGFSVDGGLEERQILAAGYKDELNPTFDLTLDYEPFDQTQITLSGGRSVSSSDYSILAQNTETTSLNLAVTQRLLEQLSLSVSLGYTQTAYTEALGSLSAIRTDDNYNFNVRLSHTFAKRGTVAVTYQYSQNNSTLAGYSFRSNQIGFELGFAY
ncbi:MAG TPA: outer membrane beta-barrel protein [Verrucomicrobiae bacterium]|nr:outer membrane beta-barrel protein [Verrucomicrobiae bacterium]